MAISSVSSMSAAEAPDARFPLLDDDAIVDGAVDHQGCPAFRSSSGGWRSASFIISVEVTERFAYYGIASNLITYLTGPLGQPMAAAAANANAWGGVSALLPLVGGFVADSYLGRYRTIVIASVLYILGLAFLTLSASLPFASPSDCLQTTEHASCSPSLLQVILFFFSLYLVAVAQGGHKPCVQAFGADQFDANDPEECKAKSSFFNWWYFSMCMGTFITLSVLNYIQDNLSWGLGFGIPCIVMAVGLIIFLSGTVTYRYPSRRDEKSSFMRIGRVFIIAAKNWKTTPLAIIAEEEAHGTLPCEGSLQFKFLNKALLMPDGSKDDENVCSIADVEEAKTVLRLVPVWFTCLVYATVFAQSSTFFTKQGATLDRSIGSNIKIPAATLQSLISLSIIVFIPIYDRILVPMARSFTRKASGISMLQRIGFGIFLSIISMAIAALVEIRRLRTAREYGLVDLPKETLPMSIWWLIPQYVLFGISDVFTMVGLQEFFYDQVPRDMRSVGLSLYLSIFGIGSFLSSFLVSVIQKATGGDGHHSWFADNINRAHLDYFYWLLAVFSAIGFTAFAFVAKSYIYRKENSL